MGIVYKGEDTKLHRTVAIKVLPAAALSSDDDRARFYREARAAASLSHPNIAVIHEIDEAVPEGSKDDDLRPFIAMEFIEGDTLEDRVKQGPMKLEEAVRIASEIAAGLEAAHKKDIVHRDIKAANVMLDDEGRAKILDFGLAQTAQSTKLTRMGSTLGTVAYMSPEQARGEEVDARTDLWALGVTLYEMIAGTHPFGGDYEQAVVYSIMNEDPEPLTAVRTGVPMGLEWIVSKCLAKKAEDRYQTGTDLLVDLRNVDLSTAGMSRISTGSMPSFSPQTQPTKPRINVHVYWAVAVAVLGGLMYFAGPRQEAQQQLVSARLEITLNGIVFVLNPKFSPNRDLISFFGQDSSGVLGIYLYDLPSGSVRLLDGTESATQWGASFSPDGLSLAFQGQAGTYTVSLPNGRPNFVSEKTMLGWSRDGNLLVVDNEQGSDLDATYLLDIETRETSLLASPDTSDGRGNQIVLWEQIKGTDKFVGHRQEFGGLIDAMNSIALFDRSDNEVINGDPGYINPRHVSSDLLTYQLGNDYGDIVWSYIDVETAKVVGETHTIYKNGQWYGWSVADDGSLLLAEHTMDWANQYPRTLFIARSVDASVEFIETDDVPGIIPTYPRFSPSGDRIAYFDRGRFLDHDLRVYDLNSKRVFPIGAGGVDVPSQPAWSPDGQKIYYHALRDGEDQIYSIEARTGASEKLVLPNAVEFDVSSDGKFLLAAIHGTGNNPRYYISRLDFETEVLVAIDSSLNQLSLPAIAPDGTHVAYVEEPSDEGERVLYISDVRGGNKEIVATKHLIGSPRWSPSGEAIYFESRDVIYKVNLSGKDRIIPASSQEPYLFTRSIMSFDISPDDGSFVIQARQVSFEKPVHENATLVLWQNWAQSLKDE